MTIAWNSVFDKFGIKTVTKTDKAKTAYVPNAAQLAAIAAAGIFPSTKRPAHDFRITVLHDKITSISASFYQSERIPDPRRRPEPRMGHAFISSSWLREGDRVLVGNIGSELFAVKLAPSLVSEDQVNFDIANKASKDTILARAKKAKGKPARKTITREDFERNPYVVAAAIIRSKGKCEMPGCGSALFLREDGTPYLEVHHVIPLGAGGDDTLLNAAALCPHCHRELHFGKEKSLRQGVLAKHVATLKL
jgi:hypothetical protein